MISGRAGLAMVNPDNLELLWANDALAALTGGARGAALVGRSLSEAFPLGDRGGLDGSVRLAKESGEPCTASVSLVSTRKGSIEIACTVYPLPDGNVLVAAEHDWTAARRTSRVR